jgi:hypothetical protein
LGCKIWFEFQKEMDTVHYKRLHFTDLNDLQAFMMIDSIPRAMGGLVEVEIGCYEGLEVDCFAHVFAFVVVQSPFTVNRILACDRGRPCRSFDKSHIESELQEEIQDRRLTWQRFTSLHPSRSMKQKAKDWKKSFLFQAWVTVLIDEKTRRFRLSTIESLHLCIADVTCRAGPGVRRVLCRFLSTTTFDQQGYPICWLVSVIWLLALLPRLTRDSDLRSFVQEMMSAKSTERFVEGIRPFTRRGQQSWRMPKSIVDEYTLREGAFDLNRHSGGGYPVVLLETALHSVGLKLKELAE